MDIKDKINIKNGVDTRRIADQLDRIQFEVWLRRFPKDKHTDDFSLALRDCYRTLLYRGGL